MKRSSTNPPRSARRIKRSVDDGVLEQRINTPKYASALSEAQVGGTPNTYIPLSLKTGAGRHHWDEVLGLLVKIRTECDAAAERLGYASGQNDGLAAVEYIANKILEAVRGERQQQIGRPKKEPPSTPPQPSKPSRGDNKTGYKTKKPFHQESHSERTKWIDELKQMLRSGRTKSGMSIDPQLAHEIAKQITILNEGLARLETPASIKQMRESMAPFLANLDGSRKKSAKAPGRSVAKKPQRAKRVPPRAQRTVTRNVKRRSR
jgi:hypothetical protein